MVCIAGVSFFLPYIDPAHVVLPPPGAWSTGLAMSSDHLGRRGAKEYTNHKVK